MDLNLETKRLLIRQMKLDDADSVLNYRSDSIANQYQGWVPKNRKDVLEFIGRLSNHINIPNTWFQVVVIHQEKKCIIGDIGIHFFDHDLLQVEVGFTIDKLFQGQGYATEALNSVVRFLFYNLNKHRIIASIDPENLKSIQLIERIGFRKEAHFKESMLIDGVWRDDLIYALLQNEWKKNYLDFEL